MVSARLTGGSNDVLRIHTESGYRPDLKDLLLRKSPLTGWISPSTESVEGSLGCFGPWSHLPPLIFALACSPAAGQRRLLCWTGQDNLGKPNGGGVISHPPRMEWIARVLFSEILQLEMVSFSAPSRPGVFLNPWRPSSSEWQENCVTINAYLGCWWYLNVDKSRSTRTRDAFSNVDVASAVFIKVFQQEMWRRGSKRLLRGPRVES